MLIRKSFDFWLKVLVCAEIILKKYIQKIIYQNNEWKGNEYIRPWEHLEWRNSRYEKWPLTTWFVKTDHVTWILISYWFRAPIDSGYPDLTVIAEKGAVVTADGLAVDWVYNHVYWTDTGEQRRYFDKKWRSSQSGTKHLWQNVAQATWYPDALGF